MSGKIYQICQNISIVILGLGTTIYDPFMVIRGIRIRQGRKKKLRGLVRIRTTHKGGDRVSQLLIYNEEYQPCGAGGTRSPHGHAAQPEKSKMAASGPKIG